MLTTGTKNTTANNFYKKYGFTLLRKIAGADVFALKL
jgi:ribosomal protein S18 acetylase RimI-like enzyme